MVSQLDPQSISCICGSSSSRRFFILASVTFDEVKDFYTDREPQRSHTAQTNLGGYDNDHQILTNPLPQPQVQDMGGNQSDPRGV